MLKIPELLTRGKAGRRLFLFFSSSFGPVLPRAHRKGAAVVVNKCPRGFFRDSRVSLSLAAGNRRGRFLSDSAHINYSAGFSAWPTRQSKYVRRHNRNTGKDTNFFILVLKGILLQGRQQVRKCGTVPRVSLASLAPLFQCSKKPCYNQG